MKTLILNQGNLINDSFNSTFQYDFPVGSVNFKNDQIALAQINMYYSWANITSSTTGGQYNNNSFSYIWIDGSINNVVMPDGYYDIPAINSFLQKTMVSNGHYLTDSSGNYIYFIQIIINQTYYASQIIIFPMITQTEATSLGYNKPSNATWSYPSSQITPQLTIPSNNNFGLILGFSSGNYPSTAQSSEYTITSNNGVPQVSPVSSLILECSLLNNSYAIPSTLLYSFAPNVSYGAQIQISPYELVFVDITDGAYNSFSITFKDQDLNRVSIQDPNCVILLIIRNKNELSINK